MGTKELQQITIKLDQTTIDYLSAEVRRRRFSGSASNFTDTFLIRLTEALNNRLEEQVFKIKK